MIRAALLLLASLAAGLGLPVAALLSTALDGELTLEPGPGPGAAGTVARLAVPLTADQDGEDA